MNQIWSKDSNPDRTFHEMLKRIPFHVLEQDVSLISQYFNRDILKHPCSKYRDKMRCRHIMFYKKNGDTPIPQNLKSWYKVHWYLFYVNMNTSYILITSIFFQSENRNKLVAILSFQQFTILISKRSIAWLFTSDQPYRQH